MSEQTADTSTPDLRQRPPRSPRVRLGGYVILPRMLDKGRDHRGPERRVPLRLPDRRSLSQLCWDRSGFVEKGTRRW